MPSNAEGYKSITFHACLHFLVPENRSSVRLEPPTLNDQNFSLTSFNFFQRKLNGWDQSAAVRLLQPQDYRSSKIGTGVTLWLVDDMDLTIQSALDSLYNEIQLESFVSKI